jgi:hypothetical protein
VFATRRCALVGQHIKHLDSNDDMERVHTGQHEKVGEVAAFPGAWPMLIRCVYSMALFNREQPWCAHHRERR